MIQNKLIQRFQHETEGNVSIMFAVSFAATFMVMGAAFDLALIHKSQAKLQNLTDAAALAALKHDGDISEKEEVFQDYVISLATLSGEDDIISTSFIEMSESDTTISLEARVNIPTELMMLGNINSFNSISVSSSVEMGIENVEIALVIDISSSMSGARIAEAKNSAEFFIDQVLNDESLNGRVAISLVPFGGTVRVPQELEYLLETPSEGLASYSENWIDGKWNQCFEFDTEDVNSGIDLSTTYKATPDFWSWNNNNPWCPREGSEFMPLTDDIDALNAKIDGLTLSDGTGSDHGMLWGYETLNHEWENQFPGGLEDTPAKNKSATKKILVFMTDGGITAQHYVRDQNMTGTPPFNSKRKVRVSYNNSLNSFYTQCDKAKADDIEVFTIGYTVTKSAHVNPLIACASSSSHYLDAATGDLESVFGDIAAAISPLRVSN